MQRGEPRPVVKESRTVALPQSTTIVVICCRAVGPDHRPHRAAGARAPAAPHHAHARVPVVPSAAARCSLGYPLRGQAPDKTSLPTPTSSDHAVLLSQEYANGDSRLPFRFRIHAVAALRAGALMGRPGRAGWRGYWRARHPNRQPPTSRRA